MYDAVKGKSLPCSGQTMAEGIAVKEPGALTTPIIRALVKDILLVGESDIEHAIASLLEIEKTLVEGAAAAAYAAITANRELFAGRKVGIVLSGGNVDMRLLSNVIVRELSREGRILSLVIYAVMGWVVVVAIKPLLDHIAFAGFVWLASGGLLYTFGIVFYAYDSRFRHWHGIWHLFVLGGSLAHYLAIAFYVL